MLGKKGVDLFQFCVAETEFGSGDQLFDLLGTA
jgi:hypothetical protein